MAVVKSLKLVNGTYGLIILFPDRIVAAGNSSPLVIGVGNDEYLIASEASAILGRTKKVIYMNGGEMAVLRKDSVKLINISGRKEKLELDV